MELAVELGVRDILLGADVAAPFFELAAQVGDARGLLCGQVDRLAFVLGEIVKLTGAVLVMLDQLPRAYAYRPCGPTALVRVVRLMPEQFPRRRSSCFRQQADATDPVVLVIRLYTC